MGIEHSDPIEPRRERGVILVFVAVMLMGIMLISGLAIDAGRAYLVKIQLSKAVDAAALGAARTLGSGNPASEARAIFKANFKSNYIGVTTADPTTAASFYSLTTDTGSAVSRVNVSASVVMPTSLMRLGNIAEVTVTSAGEATRRMVDICLVLDVSSSIGSKWGAVRDAARTFIQAFDQNTDRFCLVQYGDGARVLVPMNGSRGFDKAATMNAVPQNLPGGSTAMVEGLHHGWDELRIVPSTQQSSLRVIVLFTDGASNSVPGLYDGATSKGLRTYDFPKNTPDPDGQTWNQPQIVGLFDTLTGTQSPQYSATVPWASTTTLPNVRYLPATSTHTHARSSGMPTSFPLQSSALHVNGGRQDSVRGLRNFDAGAGRYPADAWNINNAARNLLEIIADGARRDNGQYPIRIYTIGMGDLVRYWLGTIPEQPEQILMRIANDRESSDYDSNQRAGKYYYAASAADVGPAFQALQHQIIQLTK